MHELIHDIALCIITAWSLGVLAQFFHQPVILAYLAGGFAIGPAGFGLIEGQESVAVISELGLIFLLFMIGLEIDLKKIVSAGTAILVTAASQILLGTVAGVAFFYLLGYPLSDGKFDALYLGIAAALSSTVIIVKILYDKRELDTLPGRVTLGILVLQDLFVIIFLAIQPSIDDVQAGSLISSLVRVVVLVASALIVSRFVLPPLFRSIARLPELVLVGALAWCFLVGELAARMDLSREMGALIAGVALSTFPYALDVTAKITSLRDFFVTLFFVGLGMTIPVPSAALLAGALLFALFTLVSRFLTTFTPLYMLKQGLRASLLPAINLSQVSEFSLVVMALGLEENQIASGTRGVVSFAFVLLAALSTFGMTKSHELTSVLISVLKRLGLRDLDGTDSERARAGSGPGDHAGARILLVGFFRTASSLLEELRRNNQDLLEHVAVVDFNPNVHATLRQRGIKVIYGDISHRETLLHAGVASAEILICTVPDALLKGTTNAKLVRHLREINPEAKIVAVADLLADVDDLYAAGADYVSVSRLEEAKALCEVLEAIECNLLGEIRSRVDARLDVRREVLP
ncbi:MAG TPA: cation:proton antiporter [Terrimicrobiaceae bacterium]